MQQSRCADCAHCILFAGTELCAVVCFRIQEGVRTYITCFKQFEDHGESAIDIRGDFLFKYAHPILTT